MDEGFTSLAEEMENYVDRSCEFIMSVFPFYRKPDLMAEHEIKFYRIMARAEARVREQARAQRKEHGRPAN